ncbi:MAG: ABC transporter substrate-binding protein [Chloroflexi bacterium]|nr:ABC transporter substrate-binding protein [Chloroflexota bacterium]
MSRLRVDLSAVSGAVLLVGLVVLAGCAPGTAEPAKRDRLVFRLDYLVQGPHTPVFLGLEKGYFEQEGITLEVYEGKGSATTVKLIGADQGDFGQADYGTMAAAIGEGVPVKGIFAIAQRNPRGVAVLEESGIREPKDLKGKTVAMVAGGAQAIMLPAFLAANGLREDDVKFVSMASAQQQPALFGKKVDVIFSWATNSPIEYAAEQEKIKVRRLAFADYGVNLLSTGLLASNKTISERPELAKRFIRAISRSWEAAQREPEEAVQATLRRFPDREAQILRLELTNMLKHLHTAETDGKPVGWMAEKDWATTIELLRKYGNTEFKTTDPKTFYTDDFIAAK